MTELKGPGREQNQTRKKNYRPVFLMNTDTQILNAVLAN